MKKFLTRKAMLMALCGMLTTFAASAQGWVADATGQRLYAVNDSLKFGSLFVGIGTNVPSAQLHTTGTVRFAGITQNNTFNRLLVQDTSGRLFWRDAASISGGSGWLLTGNAGTNPASNFLGTLDTARLVFRTNNTEKATILSNGNVGIGVSQAAKLLHVHNNNPNVEDNNAFLSGRAPSLYFSLTPTQPSAPPFNSPYARIGLSTRLGTFVNTSQVGDFVIHAITAGGSLVFGVGVDAQGTNGVERARLNSNGNFGINTVNPSAKLHVNGNVRFQNLPSGTGKVLVVDDSGYVYRSNTSAARASEAATSSEDVAALQQEVNVLKQTLAEVQAQLAAIKSGSLQVNANASGESFVLGNAPNPFNGSTTIKYAYPRSASKAYLTVSDLSGKQVRRYDLKGNSSNSVTLTLDGVNAGTYIYSLEVDGRIVESKKMVYTK
ncbi:T9SS type A sorting domain-containing protein [Chitinophaga ginsengisoli]|uniref:Putative secreted protein (Por secretion system target) n=1 Tax=Chitinophaga ginsengisoli TaxID=363837 RepID=A0A2P8G724_9BACT|nr:T9SS type A sorting domain-containing protein [Chitinophaga ginsengisoli]PSL29766.1 putative secreted protein (Por secretion system target) [Chitinophaga ginsengisoli]